MYLSRYQRTLCPPDHSMPLILLDIRAARRLAGRQSHPMLSPRSGATGPIFCGILPNPPNRRTHFNTALKQHAGGARRLGQFPFKAGQVGQVGPMHVHHQQIAPNLESIVGQVGGKSPFESDDC